MDLVLTMDWHPDLHWFQNSPDAGAPDCLCSWCGRRIAAEEVLLRLWYRERELRLHEACFAWVARHGGLVTADTEALTILMRGDARDGP